MYKYANFWKLSLMIGLLLWFTLPVVIAQDEVPPELTPEVTATVAVPVEVAERQAVDVQNWVDDVFGFMTENREFIIILIGIIFLGRSAPASLVERGKEAAEKTETPLDDIAWRVVELLRGGRDDGTNPPEEVADTPTETPSLPGNDEENIAPVSPPVEIGQPINENPLLFEGTPQRGTWTGSERVKEVPWNYAMSWAGGRIGTPPETILKDEYGLRVELADRDGVLFIETAVDVLYSFHRYAIVVEMREVVLNLKPDYAGETGQFIWWDTDVIDGQGYVTVLEQRHGVNVVSKSAVWVIEPRRKIEQGKVRLKLVINEAAFSDHSHIDIKRIAVEPQNASFGSDIVIAI